MKSFSAFPMTFVVMLKASAAEIDFASAPGSPLKLPSGGHSFVMGDVSRDGKPDLIVCSSNALTVLLGDGRGGFDRATNPPVKLPHGAGEMVTGDFNGDGMLDWAGAHHDHYDVMVMLGKGDGDFTPAPGSPVTAREPGKRPHTHGLAAGDVNGDGELDLVTANSEDNDVSVLLGDGRGAFRPAPHSPFRTAGNAYFVTVADVNADHRPDLIATHDEDSLVTVLLGDGRGDFRAASGSPFNLGNGAWQIIAKDLDRDGDLELVAAGQNAVAVLLGDGRGSFKRAKNSPFNTGKGSWRLAVADLNSDDKLDIVAGNVESDDISVLLMK